MELFFGPTPHRPTDGLLKIARGVGKHRSAIFSSSPVSWLSYRCAWVKWKKHKNCNSLFLSVISHNINNMQTRAVPQLWPVLEKGGNCCFFDRVFSLNKDFQERVEKGSERGSGKCWQVKKKVSDEALEGFSGRTVGFLLTLWKELTSFLGFCSSKMCIGYVEIFIPRQLRFFSKIHLQASPWGLQ